MTTASSHYARTVRAGGSSSLYSDGLADASDAVDAHIRDISLHQWLSPSIMDWSGWDDIVGGSDSLDVF